LLGDDRDKFAIGRETLNFYILFVAKPGRMALYTDDMNPSEREMIPDWTDQEYVESSRNGCPEDFRLLVQRYQKPVFAYLAARMGDPLAAEEAAQESFVRAFLSLKTLRKPEAFYAWLLGIAGRVAKEQFRSAARRERDREAAEVMRTEAESDAKEYPLEEAMAALPETYRQVIVLRYYEGLSCQDAAVRLGAPLGTVTKTLSRAYAMLRQELAAREHTESTTIQSNQS
jgi:RNA polymerase sigma-70 factor (ECF subfamily)